MNAPAPVVALHQKRGPWELASLREAVSAMRELANAVERFADTDPATRDEGFENDVTVPLLAGAFRELGSACTSHAVVALEPTPGTHEKAPHIFLAERIAQNGRALSLFTIEYFDSAKSVDALVIYQGPTPGDANFRFPELFTGDRALGRAVEAYGAIEKRIVVGE